MHYSFTENTVIQGLQRASDFVGGISKALALYYDPVEDQVIAKYTDNPRVNTIPDFLQINPGLDDEIIRYRTDFKTFMWFNKSELPFEPKKHEVFRMDVFSELENNVLMLPVINEYDNKYDLLFLYFPENFSLFKLSRTDKSLSSEHKTIIGMLLNNFLKTLAEINKNDREVLKNVKRNTISVINRYKETNDELKKLTSGINKNTHELCKHIVNELTANNNQKFLFTNAAIEKLKLYRGEIDGLKRIISNAISFVSAINFDNYSENIFIDEHHIDLKSNENKTDSLSADTIIPGRYSKTILLLNRLEEAACLVIENHQPLTGVNVGSACKKSISAPAISDALKKHKQKISSLLNQYPEKWPIIRNDFKPLINILSSKAKNETFNEKTA